jgi:dihydrofolate synthase/folylpolyglutamate synthase
VNYQKTIQFIRERAKSGTKLDLERISAVLELLGNPQQSFPAVHIAGTNGKGSTVAFFDSVLRASGYKTGRYTSPHLASYRERFSISDQIIPRERLVRLVERLKPVLDKVEVAGHGAPTEFEIDRKSVV